MFEDNFSTGLSNWRGERDDMEDAGYVGFVQTAAGLRFLVAIMCDGVGGANKGEVAAHTAVDTLLSGLRDSQLTSIPQLIDEVIFTANEQVIEQANGGQTTLALALIHADETEFGRLYIAYVGDSPIYFVRGGTVYLLNRAHNVAVDTMLYEGLSEEEATRLPDAFHLTRVLGADGYTEPDTALYYDAASVADAEMRGLEGLPLQQSDALYVATDGAFERSPTTDRPYLRKDELARHAQDTDADSVARTLIDYAKGRVVQDNATLAVVLATGENPQPKPAATPKPPRARRRLPTSMVIGIVLGLVVMGVLLVLGVTFVRQQVLAQDPSRQLMTATVEAVLAASELPTQAQLPTITATFTPSLTPTSTNTPTATPTATPSTPMPTLIPNQVVTVFTGRDVVGYALTEGISSGGTNILLRVGIGDLQANFYARPSTRLRLDTVDHAERTMTISIGGGAFLVISKDYYGGIEVPIAREGVSFLLTDGCMTVNHDVEASAARMSCYAGTCGYRTFGDPVVVEPGEEALVFIDEGGVRPVVDTIALDEFNIYINSHNIPSVDWQQCVDDED